MAILRRTGSRTGLAGRVTLILAASCVVLPESTAGQEITVSGIVVERGQPTPIGGAEIRLTGLPPAVTDVDGRFRFDVVPGRYTLSVEAFGYLGRAHELLVRADTALTIELEADPVVLDSMLVYAGTITVRGSVRDSASGLRLFDPAQVRIHPGGRVVGAVNGSFTLPDIPRNRPITLVVEVVEYLPARVELIAERDTTLDVALAIDSVAVRMIAHQVTRLETRAQTVARMMRDLDRDQIRREGVMSLGELILRRLPGGRLPDTDCYFYDDMQYSKADFEDMINLPPESIERVEIFGFRGRMIRVYSTKYVVRLMRMRRLMPIPMTCT